MTQTIANKMTVGGFTLAETARGMQRWVKGRYVARLHFCGTRLTSVYREYPGDQDSVQFPSLRSLIHSANSYPAGS